MKIAAMSDLHGFQPDVPDADLVIIAGDICPDSIRGLSAAKEPALQGAWFDSTMRPWIKSLNRPTLITWGNHDFCDKYVRREGYLNHRIVVDHMVKACGLYVFLTPWSNRFMNWAWMKSPEDLGDVYRKIPSMTDVIVSHQPPWGCGDLYPNLQTGEMEHIGSKELLSVIAAVRPQLVICGHLHGGYGRYQYQEIPIYNVSVVNDAYQLVHPVTVIDVESKHKEIAHEAEETRLHGDRR
jgi:Icc-related predicted phosphoesterase